jgi:hypothetical protein
VVAVHSTEHPENLADDVELEFVIPEVAADYSVTVLLSAFLRTWLPLVSGGERAIVIVVCNPHQATIAQPAAVGGTPVYYPLGDVESWVDDDDGHQTIRLVAQAWPTTEGDG